jgi:hypothetical protein
MPEKKFKQIEILASHTLEETAAGWWLDDVFFATSLSLLAAVKDSLNIHDEDAPKKRSRPRVDLLTDKPKKRGRKPKKETHVDAFIEADI